VGPQPGRQLSEFLRRHEPPGPLGAGAEGAPQIAHVGDLQIHPFEHPSPPLPPAAACCSLHYSKIPAPAQGKTALPPRLLIYNYIANRQRLRCVLQINERRYINMRIKVYGKSHLEGIAKKTGNPYNFNQVHYLGKARNVEGQAALTLALDPRDYPIDRIEVGKEYDVEFDQRGYVIGFTLAR